MRKVVVLCLTAIAMLGALAGCGDDKASNDTQKKKRDAIISKDCPVTATPSLAPGEEAGLRNEAAATGDAAQDAVIADYAEYWRRYFLALQSQDVKGSCVKVYISTSLQSVDSFVDDLKKKQERYVGYATLSSVDNVILAGDSAILQACLDQSTMHKQSADGSKEPAGGKTPLKVEVVNADGLWRIASQQAGDHTC